jgi:DNA-directed RNA polymerase specialized sigma24 family protein
LVAESEQEMLFERILEENKRRLHIFARANARGDSWRDLEREILLRVWRSLDRYQGRSNLKTWFRAVACNTLRHFKPMNNRAVSLLWLRDTSAACSRVSPERPSTIDQSPKFVNRHGK